MYVDVKEVDDWYITSSFIHPSIYLYLLPSWALKAALSGGLACNLATKSTGKFH